MTIRLGINGFGRIGRLVFRVAATRSEVKVVGINDLASPGDLANLLKYDSVHGRYPGTVQAGEGCLTVDGREIKVTGEKDPANLPWKDLGVTVGIESTGVFRQRAQIAKHLTAGAKKVLLSVPSKDEIDATIVLGVNDDDLKADHEIVSNASCTTNCLAPVAKVLHDSFGLVEGLMTTVHAYTNDQNVADFLHKDPRRARAAAINIIPTTTGAAAAVGKVIPDLKGKLNGLALRVPVANGSIVDLVATTRKSVTAEAVNAAVKKAAEGPLKGILSYTEDPIVSSDIIGDPHSSVFDGASTMTLGENLVKVLSWYDNEWGYSNRMVDLIIRMMSF